MVTPALPPDRPTGRPDEAADVALLTGPALADLMAEVLAAEGVEPAGVELHAVHHRPGVGVSVGSVVRWRSGPGAEDRIGEEYLVASTSPVPGPVGPGVTTALLAGRPVTVWRFADDPALPGLAAATAPDRVAGLLGADDVDLKLVTYRPLRRAVLRARTTGPGAARTTVYLKVVRPHTAADLLRRHELLAAAGLPVAGARLVAPGVLALEEVAGRPLTDALAADGAADLDPTSVRALLDALPAAATTLPHRPAWADRLRHHAHAAAVALPGHAARVRALAADLQHLIDTSDPGPVVATHGDLHDANLLTAGGRLVGLLDVDSVGPGHRVDDLACLLAHLSVLPAIAPQTHRHVTDELPRWVAALEADGATGPVDPVALRARAGAVVLSLVAGARREDDPAWADDAVRRLAVAAQWLDAARAHRSDQPSERSLIHAS